MICHFNNMMTNKIIQEVNRRGIDSLIHFTPTVNLFGIYEHGRIMSRKLIEELDVDFTDLHDFVKFTDDLRIDDKDYINVSIQECNHFLFDVFVQKTQHQAEVSWCIIKLCPSILLKENILFSKTNAANSFNKKNGGISSGIDGFNHMFLDQLLIKTSTSRRVLSRRDLKLCYPTCRQAEVLVKKEIELKYIKSVCFQNKTRLASAKAALYEFDTSLFIVDDASFNTQR